MCDVKPEFSMALANVNVDRVSITSSTRETSS